MMEQIPDDEPQFEDNKVTMWDRVRPIFYLAAMFAGLGLFFKAIVFLTIPISCPTKQTLF